MSPKTLIVHRLGRKLSRDKSEAIDLQPGVNLVVGKPNAGKTIWLRMLDYAMGDTEQIENVIGDELADKYDALAAELELSGENVVVERRWKEAGAKTKVFVNGEGMYARDFQHEVLRKLNIPLLHYPKGDPYARQTWPELSWRELLRHIYRQQLFWSDLADRQPERSQYACLMQFLGVAEHLYVTQYGELIDKRRKIDVLKTQREQFQSTLNEISREVVAEEALQVAVTPDALNEVKNRLLRDIEELRTRRETSLSESVDQVLTDEEEKHRREVHTLSARWAEMQGKREHTNRTLSDVTERLEELRQYRTKLVAELDRLSRADVARDVLADLKVTHCPACDQEIKSPDNVPPDTCHLCGQKIESKGEALPELAAKRISLEKDRLNSDLREAEQLIELLDRERQQTERNIGKIEEELQWIELQLHSTRTAVAVFAHQDLSAIDMEMGRLFERHRQLERLSGVLKTREQLSAEMRTMEKELASLETEVQRAGQQLDFDTAEDRLSDGMNEYLNAIRRLRRGVWEHGEVSVSFSRDSFNVKVGKRRWNKALGGTDTLYFLMAYHYALMKLTTMDGCHYPGLAILDLPPDFLGESIADKENFIIQPFVELLSRDGYENTQLIAAGAAFEGLEDANRIELSGQWLSH